MEYGVSEPSEEVRCSSEYASRDDKAITKTRINAITIRDTGYLDLLSLSIFVAQDYQILPSSYHFQASLTERSAAPAESKIVCGFRSLVIDIYFRKDPAFETF